MILKVGALPNSTLVAPWGRSEGVVFECAAAGAEAFEYLRAYAFDVALLDAKLPDMTVAAAIKQVRMLKIMTPLIVLAWMATTAERVAALDLGADDFLTMPIVPAELFARMHAAVRRSQGHARSVLRVGAVEVDIAMSEVRVLGARMQVSRREFNVLELLWMRRGEVVTLNSILDHLYAGLDAPEIKGTQVIICRLRKRLRAAGAPRLIDTVWGRGYIVREPYLTPVELTPA